METSTTPPPVQLPPSADQSIHIAGVIRDAIIILVLTFLGGVVVGIAVGNNPDPTRFAVSLAVSNTLFGIVGFTVSGCLAAPRRWRHLTLVAFSIWIINVFNAFFGVSFLQWLAGGPYTFMMMAIGGTLSYIFKKRKDFQT